MKLRFECAFVCRLLSIAAVALLFAGGAVRCRAADTLTDAEKNVWKQRLLSFSPNSFDSIYSLHQLSQLDPDTGLAILQATWSEAPSTETKLYLLNVMLDHPRIVDILHLGVTDPSLPVQNRAIQLLEPISFINFADDFSAYAPWRARFAGKPVEETMRESCRDFLAGLAHANEIQKTERVALLQRVAYNMGTGKSARMRRKAMLDSGLPDVLAKWVGDPNAVWTAFAVLRNLRMDEPYLRKVILPLTDPKNDTNTRRQAMSLLAMPENTWATDLLLKTFLQAYPDPDAEAFGYSLAQLGDPRVIPTFVSLMEADNSPEGQRILANVLNILTGNTNGLAHDAAWWHTWWTRNSARFPAEVRALPFPKLKIRPREALGAGGVPRAPTQVQIGGDIKRTYWLISPLYARRTAVASNEAQKDAPGLLVVLPPDGDGAAASLFWQKLASTALKDHYYVAVAVAPKWIDGQSPAWLTQDSVKQVKEAKFTTEKFAAEIAKDVTATHEINPDRIYLHGAAESGLAAYSASLEDTTPFKGFYLLSSPFRSAALPALSHAKNRRYLIQHSVEDKVAPYVLAGGAQKLLTEQGATARLATYKGRHGYLDDDNVAAQVGEAITWLEGSGK